MVASATLITGEANGFWQNQAAKELFGITLILGLKHGNNRTPVYWRWTKTNSMHSGRCDIINESLWNCKDERKRLRFLISFLRQLAACQSHHRNTKHRYAIPSQKHTIPYFWFVSCCCLAACRSHLLSRRKKILGSAWESWPKGWSRVGPIFSSFFNCLTIVVYLTY